MIIRTLIAILSLTAPIAAIHAQQPAATNNFFLEGSLKGRDTGIIVLVYDGHSDTAIVTAGKFSFKGRLEQPPTLAYLLGNIKSMNIDDPNRKLLFLEPGNMTIELSEGQFPQAMVTGSATQDDMDQYLTLVTPIRKTLAASRSQKQKWDSALQVKNQITYPFIASHPNSFISPYLMSLYQNDGVSPDSAKKLYHNFSPAVKHSFWGTRIKDAIASQENSAPKHRAPDFTSQDINGRSITCSSFKGKKYVLLDFWASTCAPCRELSPHINELYAKYHDKGLEVIAISGDLNARAWRNAVLKDSISHWINIGIQQNKQSRWREIEDKYSVMATPTLILIDKKGYIVSRYVGLGSEDGLDDKLKELLPE